MTKNELALEHLSAELTLGKIATKDLPELLAKFTDPEGSLEFQVAAGPLAKITQRKEQGRQSHINNLIQTKYELF